jgi:hypothetical protein
MGLIEDVMGAMKSTGLIGMCAERGLEPDDVCQQVIERSLRRKNGVAFVEGNTRTAYAVKAVKWILYSRDRHARRFPSVPVDEQIASSIPTPEDVAIEKQREPEVRAVLAYASADPMLRAFLAGSSYAASARELGHAPSTMTRRRRAFVEKAKKDLRITQKYAGSCVY